ncbi:RNA pyrophosphohydrolase [Blastochloris viridis]|nr:RNA pyrophosphohydrolase [Blastochloris viridis]
MARHKDVSPEHLPYRRCVGVVLLNAENLVFVGSRTEGPEHTDSARPWQMPQGGIDDGEEPYPAALRELYEETNVRSVELLAEARDWFTYDLPPELVGHAWKGKYRGQTQKWFALRFTGTDSEIDIHHPAGGAHPPEFKAWRWERLERLPELIVPFKRAVYHRVVQEFAHLVG